MKYSRRKDSDDDDTTVAGSRQQSRVETSSIEYEDITSTLAKASLATSSQKGHRDSDDDSTVVASRNVSVAADSLQAQYLKESKNINNWCQENQFGYIETSAKEGTGVQAAVVTIVGLAMESKRVKEALASGEQLGSARSPAAKQLSSARVNLNELYAPKPKQSCCTMS
jgi:hypothetical protein